MEWIEPKTDWSGNDKCKPEDFNRIENNTAYLCELTEVETDEVKTDWDRSGYPFGDELNRIESNIEALRVGNGFPKSLGWENAKTSWGAGQGISYADLLRMEKNLAALLNMAISLKANYKYCGTFSCGGVDFL